MNTTKRLISALVCLAMLFSLTTSFAYALGDASLESNATVQNGEDNESPAPTVNEEQGVASDLKGASAEALVGANPKADYLDLVDLDSDDVYVADAAITADSGTYTLEWDDVPGQAPRTHDYAIGVKAFKTAPQAAAKAASDGKSNPIILVKSLPYVKTDTGVYDCRISNVIEGRYNAKYYTEAYRTLPYVVSNTPGEAWTVNPEYEKRTLKVFQINPTAQSAAYDLTIAGFSVVSYLWPTDYEYEYNSGMIDLTAVNASYKQNLTLVNTYFSATHAHQYYPFMIRTAANADYNAGSTLKIVNIYVNQSANVPNFMGNTTSSAGTLPYSNFTMDGWYFDTANGAGTYMKNESSTEEQDVFFRSNYITFEMKNCYFLNVDSHIRFRGRVRNGEPPNLQNQYYKHYFNMTNNTFYNSSLARKEGQYGAVSVPDGLWNNLTINNNHIEYNEDAPYFSSETGYALIGGAYAEGNGTDSAQVATVTNNRLIGLKRDFIVPKAWTPYTNANTYWTVSLSENYYTPGTDKTAQGVSYDASAHSTTADNYYLDYDMTVLNTDNISDNGLFSKAYNGEDFTNEAVYVNPAVASVSRCINAEVEGIEYTFIKGKNAFATVAEVFTALGNNSNPQIILGEWSGDTSLVIPYAARIYGVDYKTSPHVKTGATVDGSDWAANSAWTGKTKILHVRFDASAQGAVSIYGIEMYGRILDNYRPEGTDLDIVMENVKFTGSRENEDNVIANFQNANSQKQSGSDSFTARNIYICVTGTTKKLFNDCFPAFVTFDNLWLDGTGLTSNYTNIVQVAKTSNFTITNSYLKNCSKNADYGFIRFISGSNLASYGANTIDKSLTFTNNVMYNFVAARRSGLGVSNDWGIFDIATAGYSAITISGNKISVADSAFGPNTNLIYTTYHTSYIANIHSLALTVTENILNGINPDIKLWYSNATSTLIKPITFNVSGNYTTGTYSADLSAAGVPLTANAHPIDADDTFGAYVTNYASGASSKVYGILMDADGNILDGNAFTFDGIDEDVVTIADYIRTKYDSQTWNWLDDAVATVNVGKVTKTAELKIISDDETETGADVITLTFNRSTSFDILNRVVAAADRKESDDENRTWLGWRGVLDATGNMFADADTTDLYTVGTIFLAGNAELDNAIAELTAGVANCNDRADIDALVDAVNDGKQKCRAYLIPAQKQLYFDDIEQAYTYRYNFLVKKGITRATVMYAIYKDSLGKYQIVFSDGGSMLAQVAD